MTNRVRLRTGLVVGGLCLVGAAVAGFSRDGFRRVEPTPRPKAVLAAPEFEADVEGAESGGQLVGAQDFQLTNPNPFPLTLRNIGRSCQCAEAQLKPEVIPAGGTATFHFAVHGPRSVPTSASIELQFGPNGTPSSRFRLNVRAPNVPPYVLGAGDQWSVGRLSLLGIESGFTFYAVEREDQPNWIRSVSASAGGVDVKCEPSSDVQTLPRKLSQRGYNVRLRWAGAAGTRRFDLSLLDAAGKSAATLPVSFEVPAQVEAAPTRIWMVGSPQKPGESAKFVDLFSRDGKPLGKVQGKFTSPVAGLSGDVFIDAGEAQKVRLKLVLKWASLPGALHHGVVSIATQHPTLKSLSIPVELLLR